MVFLFSQTSGTGATVTCKNDNINPENYLNPDNIDGADQEGGAIVGGRRRRRRNAVPFVKGRKLRKRQEVIDGETTSNQTIVSSKHWETNSYFTERSPIDSQVFEAVRLGKSLVPSLQEDVSVY